LAVLGFESSNDEEWKWVHRAERNKEVQPPEIAAAAAPPVAAGRPPPLFFFLS
jgi:hypothetical protein